VKPRLAVLLALVCAGACGSGRPEGPAAPEPSTSPVPPAARLEPVSPPAGKGSRDAGRDAEKPASQVELKTEEREANPYSESVTLKLAVSPSVRATVLWGARQMAQLEPGKMEVELKRPRGSGPLDLDLRAEGYLPHHTRLYADRNDRVAVRLYRIEEAPSLFGYNRSPDPKPAAPAKPEKPK